MSDVVAKVVELKPGAPDKGTIDLRQDNRISELLDEFEDASNAMSEAKVRYAAARIEILEKMGDAKKAIVDGWRLSITKSFVKEHTVKSFMMTRLSARRKGKKKQFPK